MIQKTIPAQEVNLQYLIDNFNLQWRRDEQFFREWQEDLPEITDLGKQFLDQVKVFVTRNPNNELYDVLRILKQLSQIAVNENSA